MSPHHTKYSLTSCLWYRRLSIKFCLKGSSRASYLEFHSRTSFSSSDSTCCFLDFGFQYFWSSDSKLGGYNFQYWKGLQCAFELIRERRENMKWKEQDKEGIFFFNKHDYKASSLWFWEVNRKTTKDFWGR
jgi:hypothetical protein